MEYHKPGEKFEYDGKMYRVVSPCHYCALSHSCSNPSDMKCNATSREDDYEICYEEVKLKDSVAIKIMQYVLSVLYSTSFILAVMAGLYVITGRQYIWAPFGIASVLGYIGNTILGKE